MALPRFLSKLMGSDGSRIKTNYAQWSTPAPWRNEDGVYIGLNGQAWIYRSLDLNPIKWEDNESRIGIAKQLGSLLSDLGQLSKEPIGGIRALAANREIHLESITWQEILTSPAENSPALVEFQSEAYGVTVPRRVLLIGVKLVPSIIQRKDGERQTTFKSVQELVKRAMSEDIPPLELYREDLEKLDRIFKLHDAKMPTTEEFDQLDSWFNNGMGADVLIEEQVDRLIVADSSPMQFAAVRRFDVPKFQQPDHQWIMDTLSHPGDAPHLISVRAELEPTKTTRGRARMSQRRIQANIEEENKSGDLEKMESSEAFQLAKDFENYLAEEARPMLANCSILMAREITDEAETYMDFLDTTYGIQMTTLEHRQILALDETLPASNTRVNPWLQDVNVPMIAAAGFQAFSSLGDDAGCFVGFVDPDGSPLFIDPAASSRQNLPPAFGVFGDPGSGKSSPLDTPVMTPEGIVTMGDLRPGMEVFTPHGDPTRVETIHPQGELNTYLVTAADGRTLETSDEHLWHVTSLEDLTNWRNMELKDFMNDLVDEDGNYKWMIPAPRPLEFQEQLLAADPYTIGLVAVAGPEVQAELQLNVTPTASAIKDMIYVELHSSIPSQYLTGSVEQRIALLQGVLDASATANEGIITASSLHPVIAAQVQALVWSLGGVAQLESDAAPLTDVVMELPADIVPFRDRSDVTYEPSGLTRFMLPVVSVEFSGVKEQVCITVADDEHLYVSGEFVTSHNTFFAQNFATQCVLYGLPVFFINPKAAGPLDGLVDYINEYTTASASKISMMKAEQEPGAFDPFSFANDLNFAAEVAGAHILDALDVPQDPLRRDLRLALQEGLRRGAEQGAACVWDALDYIVNEDFRVYLKNIIDQQVSASSLFALGVAKKPRPKMNIEAAHLTLVHFDRELGLPTSSDRSQYTHAQRIAISAVNLVTKAALEVLIANRGGVLILDEAWTLLGQPDAQQTLNRISREGRSLSIVPVFLTQKIKDIVTSELSEFMSRVLVLKLNSADEASAAFRICGLEPTPERLDMLRDAGPKPPKDGKPAVWAQGMYRDLQFRHSWVALGPTPEQAMKSWSTNPEEKRRYEEARLARLEAERQAQQEEASIMEQIESMIPEGAVAIPEYESDTPEQPPVSAAKVKEEPESKKEESVKATDFVAPPAEFSHAAEAPALEASLPEPAADLPSSSGKFGFKEPASAADKLSLGPNFSIPTKEAPKPENDLGSNPFSKPATYDPENPTMVIKGNQPVNRPEAKVELPPSNLPPAKVNESVKIKPRFAGPEGYQLEEPATLGNQNATAETNQQPTQVEAQASKSGRPLPPPVDNSVYSRVEEKEEVSEKPAFAKQKPAWEKASLDTASAAGFSKPAESQQPNLWSSPAD